MKQNKQMHKEGCCGGNHHEHHHDHKEHHANCGCGQQVTTSMSMSPQIGCGLQLESHYEEEEPSQWHHHHDGCCQECEDVKTSAIGKSTHKFRVEGLDCASCAMKVEKAISSIPEIKEASLNFSTSMLLLNTSKDEKSILEKVNETAAQVESGVHFYQMNTQNSVVKPKNHGKEIITLLLGLITLLAAVYVEINNLFPAVYLFVVSYLIAGYHVLWTAIRNILKREMFDENFLMSIATLGAFYVGDFAEGVAVMLFYGLGELFQSIAVNRSRKSISELMNIRSEYANILVDGKEKRITPEQIKINDLLVVRAGERIPVDGIIVEGTTSLDMSALNGESLPRDVYEQEEVLAGCLNLQGVFTMKATRPLEESTVSRVLELVENAASKKAPIEKFITRFSRVYTPTVVVAAILLVCIPTLIGWGSFDEWLYKGCSFLVISCPCALVVSVPLGLFAGIGGASKKGVLIKGGNYLELLGEVDTIVFDKTGTITKGSFQVQEIIGDEDTLMYAAYGESYSNHPIAKSIVNAYSQQIDQAKINDYEEVPGHGTSSIFKGKKLLVGNTKWMKEMQIQFEETTILGSHVYVAYDSLYKGCVVIRDEIKKTSALAMQQLKQAGIKKCVMLTGDKQEMATAIALEAGLDEVHAELLPQDKVSILETYLQDNSKVAFVGDGINDAPVLMRADIGIAMGGIGSDAAIEASDIVLMNDDLLSIPTAIKIAKKTKRILIQNIVFSLVIKVGILALAAFGFVNMWMGVFADVGVTLIAIMNAMRAMINK